VHRSTAARALNPATSGMLAPATVKLVQAAAESLQYTANAFARGLRTQHSMTIGLLLPDLNNPLFPPIVRGIESALLPHGYTALIANTDNDPERELMHFHALLSRQVDGFIIATARNDDAVLDEAYERDLAVALVNRSDEHHHFPLVSGDDRSGIRAAVDHLYDLGHRRIAHLAGPLGVSSATVRESAFREAIRARGIRPRAAPVLACEGFTEAGGADAAAALLDAHPGITAIVASNDLIALGAIRILRTLGLACPQDISVTGFNDMRFADAVTPALTTVRVDHHLLGKEVAQLLLEQLRDRSGVAKALLLPVYLVTRESTAPPRELRRGIRSRGPAR
jgi:LacI family transcriptional regulator